MSATLTPHQQYVLRAIAERCAAHDSARVTGPHLATARSLQRRGMVVLNGHQCILTAIGLAESASSLEAMSDDELHDIAADLGSSFRDKANEILDAREADDAARRTPAGARA